MSGAAESPSRFDRARRRSAALQARAQRITERAEQARREHDSVAAVYEMVERDSEVGGGIIAGALAYRLFIWLLPLALVLVAGLGLASGASSSSPADVASSLGLAGLVSSSVASAAKSSTRWYALLVGIPILLWATRSVLRVLIGAHRLVWTDLRAAAPKPTPRATLRFFGLVICFFAIAAGAGAAGAASFVGGLVVSLVLLVPYGGLWLLISLRLPHRSATWKELVPGALVVAAGFEVLQLAAMYLIAPMALAKQGTYGALGVAAALLLALYFLSRLFVAGAVVNATLYERRAR